MAAYEARQPLPKSVEQRLHRIRPSVEKVLASVGVPNDVLAVAVVESGIRRDALSPAGARGMWQLRPATARRYGLNVSKRRDDRLNIEKATRAAARYLLDLYKNFNSWELALAAYNAGEGTVQRAIERAKSADFDVLRELRLLPEETRNYVPKVLALVESFSPLREAADAVFPVSLPIGN